MMAIEHMLEHERRVAAIAVDKTDPTTGKPKLASVVAAEVEEQPSVAALANRLLDHTVAEKGLKALTAIYQGNVERISREITARHNAYERAHQGTGR